MKRFAYTRLAALSKDYGFYVPLAAPIGFVEDVAKSDLLDSRQTYLFLESRNGLVTFGVREQLSLRDEVGRLITHSTGFQLEGGEAIPSFAALRDRLDAITTEAYEMHQILDSNPQCGRELQAANMTFGPAPLGRNTWDDMVRRIQKNPAEHVIGLFDVKGQPLSLPFEITPQTNDTSPDGKPDRKAVRARGDFSSEIGIQSSVELAASERVHIPPPPPPIEASSFMHDIGRAYRGFMDNMTRPFGGEPSPKKLKKQKQLKQPKKDRGFEPGNY